MPRGVAFDRDPIKASSRILDREVEAKGANVVYANRLPAERANFLGNQRFEPLLPEMACPILRASIRRQSPEKRLSAWLVTVGEQASAPGTCAGR